MGRNHNQKEVKEKPSRGDCFLLLGHFVLNNQHDDFELHDMTWHLFYGSVDFVGPLGITKSKELNAEIDTTNFIGL